jgi:pimeloyl-ACP methyl ester carboxylesterase
VSRRTEHREARDGLIRKAEIAAYESFELTPMARRLTVDTGHGTTDIRVVELGGARNGVPILLLHGIGSVNVMSAPLLCRLGDRHVIAVDWPGHGLSDRCVMPRDASLRAHARAVLTSLLDALDLPVVDLVGHSLGAQISLYASLDLGDRVRRVVLLGAPGAAFEGVQPLPIMKVMATPGVGVTLLSLPLSVATFRRTSDQMLGVNALAAAGPAVQAAAHLFAGRRANARSIASFFRTLLQHGRVRPGVALAADDLSSVKHPVLMVWGAADVFQTPSSARAAIDALPDGRLLELAGAGHAPWLQHEEAVAAAVRDHLA